MKGHKQEHSYCEQLTNRSVKQDSISSTTRGFYLVLVSLVSKTLETAKSFQRNSQKIIKLLNVIYLMSASKRCMFCCKHIVYGKRVWG